MTNHEKQYNGITIVVFMKKSNKMVSVNPVIQTSQGSASYCEGSALNHCGFKADYDVITAGRSERDRPQLP